jgi:PHD/YefM family antitoxin component YafN of YafNO toxin-antitoxin module
VLPQAFVLSHRFAQNRTHICERGSKNRLITMIKVSAAEFQRNTGCYQDLALTEPVAVTRNGRERTVMISTAECMRLKRRDREVLGLDDFTDDDIAALESTRAPDSSKALDHEVD